MHSAIFAPRALYPCSGKELCRKHGFSEPSHYAWKAKFGGMKASDAQRLKALKAENGKLKRLLANSMLEIDAMREVLKGK